MFCGSEHNKIAKIIFPVSEFSENNVPQNVHQDQNAKKKKKKKNAKKKKKKKNVLQ